MAVLFYGQSFSKSMTNILSKSVFLSVMKMSMQSGIARELDPLSFFHFDALLLFRISIQIPGPSSLNLSKFHVNILL